MRDKIIDVMKKIMNQPDKIEGVAHSEGDEYYFKYNDIFMSVMQRQQARGPASQFGIYSVYIYPHYKGSVEALQQSFEFGNEDEIELVGFHVNEFKDADKDVFKTFYRFLSDKYFGVDKILDSILKS